MEELFLKTLDNVKIAINHYKSGFDEVVIVAPGWCMTKDSKAFTEISNDFNKEFDVITIDFRGHGKSSGFYTFTAKEIFDLETVINYARQNYKKIHLAGFSLGGALVLLYASKNNNISKVIAVSAPSDFDKIENRMWKKEAWAETFKKFEYGRFLSIRPGIIFHKKLKPINFVDKIEVPTLFIAGEKDPTVYPWHTEELFKKAKCKKIYKLYKNGIHAEDLFLYFKDDFSELTHNFLKNS